VELWRRSVKCRRRYLAGGCSLRLASRARRGVERITEAVEVRLGHNARWRPIRAYAEKPMVADWGDRGEIAGVDSY
jgi:hypothetical protein